MSSESKVGGLAEEWPEYVMLRDTKLHDDTGGLGQRIYTTAGAGYTKRKYVRDDLAALSAHGQPVVDEAMIARAEAYMTRVLPGRSTACLGGQFNFCDLLTAALTGADHE